MSTHRLTRLAIAIGLSATTTSVLAAPQPFHSARAFAMGGTGVAVAHPSAAPSVNPALMAGNHHDWADDFGLMFPSVHVRAADEEEVGDQVDDIQDTIDNLDRAINANNVADAQARAGELRDQLQAFDRDTVRANAGLGVALAFPGKRLSVGVFADGTLTATARGEYDEDDDALLQDIENGILTPGATDNLESRGKVLAASVAEFGISFARDLELANGQHLQLGISPKYVSLHTFQYTATVDDFDEDDFDNSDYETEKSGFNLDLGAAYSFGDHQQWTLAASARNLIPMELDSARSQPAVEQQRTLKLDPMVTVGVAHKGNFHVVTAEVELTEKEAFGFEDDTQWAAIGAEFDAFRYAQLRVGVRHNLASNDDNAGIEEKTQYTAGLGLNLMGVRLDLGALYSDADVGAALELGTAF